jgi:hypothetical protein
MPPDIPARPQDAYTYAKEGWAGYEDGRFYQRVVFRVQEIRGHRLLI